jgi:formylglycine-generating enzyme required for sulfatase activity
MWTGLCALAVAAWTAWGAPEATPPDVIDAPAKAVAAQKAWAEKLGKPVEWTNSLGMRFRLIPPGEYVMGADDLMGLETPHTVRLTQPFYLGVFEVTRKEWEAVTGKVHSTFFPGEDVPINFVSWYHVQDFLGALNKKEKAAYRLPTEAEWEYAARAGSAFSFITGNTSADLDQSAWHAANSGNVLHPVGQKAANAFGLHDMLGNAWEWCDDFYDADFYAAGPKADPKNTRTPTFRMRVLRGGAMYFNAYFCRVSHRAWYQESRTEKYIGFRVALPISAAEPPPAPAK